MLKKMILKELRRVFVDKRLVFSVFILPAISNFALITLMGVMFSNMQENVETYIGSVYIKDASNEFKQFYEEYELNQSQNDVTNNSMIFDVKYLDNGEDIVPIKNSIKAGDKDLLVVFEEDFSDKVKNYKDQAVKPEIKTFYNATEELSNETRTNFVERVLTQYENVILQERFGNLNHVKAFDIDRDITSSIIQDEKKASGKVLSSVIPMLITILLFAGAMGVGVDTIAGEKERGTMATLLLTPVKRETIAAGKLISLGVISISSAIITFSSIMAAMPFASALFTGGQEGVKVSLNFSILNYIQLLLIMLTLVGVYVGLICLVSVRAKSVKEASTYNAPIFMLVMFAAYSNLFSQGTEVVAYKFLIPVYNSVIAIKSLFEFELTMQQFGLTILGNVFAIVVLAIVIGKTFNDEKIMLNA